MSRLWRVWSIAGAVALLAVPAVRGAQGDKAVDPQGIERLKAATGGRAEVSLRRGTGAAQFVRLAPGKGEASLAPQSARGSSATDLTKAFFAEYGGIFGIQDPETQLHVMGEQTDRIGMKHAKFQQVHDGVPVFGAELKGHVDSEGRLVAVNGTAVPGITVDTTPRRTDAEAGTIAVGLVAASLDSEAARSLSARSSRLVVYRTGLLQGVEGGDHLTYEVEVSNGGSVREFVFVDAHTGKKVDQITGILDGLFRRAYDGAGLPTVPPSYPGSPYWVEGDSFPTASTEADNMITASGETHTLFNEAFGYDSFDAAGATMDAIFNRGYGCPNASWNGTFISFCPGVTTDDVTAHEWGHAYTQYTDNLIYFWQSGALNEAYSDIFGEAVDLINGRGGDTPNTARAAGACSTFTTLAPKVTINAPAAIAGVKNAGTAAFGPAAFTLTNDVVQVNDGVGVTNDGCTTPFVNAADVAGKIAFIDRGTCGFTIKVKNAQLNGAIAAMIGNNQGGTVIVNMGGTDPTITIPSLSVTQNDGTAIKGQLVSTTVNATLSRGETGTDNSLRWLMGEDATGFAGAIRDMWNPTCYTNPGKVTDTKEYICTTFDNGGVHINSGIPNHMFALLVDGGFYNGQNIQAIGLTKAVHIYFRAKFYQVTSTDFPEHASAIEQACSDLRGINLASLTTSGPGGPSGQFISANDCTQVSKAIAAVELRTPPTFCNFVPQLGNTPPANVCGVGPANLLASETVEGDISDWTLSHEGVYAEFTPRDWAKANWLPAGRTGSAFFAPDADIGTCAPGGDESGVLYLDSPAITLPVTPGFPRLLFEHYVATEGGWDGGNVKVSVNGGPWLGTVLTQFTYSPYKAALFTAPQGNTNPLAGQQAFTGSDGGTTLGSWGTSILDLAGMAQPGDSVRVRFAFGTDGCGGNDGWYVDNIGLYQCTAGGAATISIDDVTVTEGDTGSQSATFTLTLSEASATTVSVRVSTADDTALAGSDYTAVTNQLVSFSPGTTTRTVVVPVLGDTALEGTERFFVNLSSPVNVAIARSQGIGTIVDNETGPGDFNGDGKPDLLLRNASTGALVAWYMDGVTRTGGAALSASPGTSWVLVGVADFGSVLEDKGVGALASAGVPDGKPDILFRNQATGDLVVWFMDGVTKAGGAALSAKPGSLSWVPVGVGDFGAAVTNGADGPLGAVGGDGKPDILFRNQATGDLVVWLMDGVTKTGGAAISTKPGSLLWAPAGVADFNADGKPDILFRNQATAQHVVWLMDGVTRTDGAALVPGGPADASWQAVAFGDYDTDGTTDIVWQRSSTGDIVVWYMDGVTRTGGAPTSPSKAVLPWQVVGPR